MRLSSSRGVARARFRLEQLEVPTGRGARALRCVWGVRVYFAWHRRAGFSGVTRRVSLDRTAPEDRESKQEDEQSDRLHKLPIAKGGSDATVGVRRRGRSRLAVQTNSTMKVTKRRIQGLRSLWPGGVPVRNLWTTKAWTATRTSSPGPTKLGQVWLRCARRFLRPARRSRRRLSSRWHIDAAFRKSRDR